MKRYSRHRVCLPPARRHAGLGFGRLGRRLGPTHVPRAAPRSRRLRRGSRPATIKAAYGFSTSATAGAGETIAIVDAYDDPTAEADLGVFSTQFGLPACTTANGCFKKVSQTGSTRYPSANTGWALEISLDVQWAHAIAPGAKILLVEASSASTSNLMAAEDYAGAHAQYVSNSWGGSESRSETSLRLPLRAGGRELLRRSRRRRPAGPVAVVVPQRHLRRRHDAPLRRERQLHLRDRLDRRRRRLQRLRDGDRGSVRLRRLRPGQLRRQARHPRRLARRRPGSGVSVYDSTRYSGQDGLVGRRRNQRLLADVGRPVRRRRRGRERGLRLRHGITFRDITSGNNGAACLVGFDLCSGRGSWTGATP